MNRASKTTEKFTEQEIWKKKREGRGGGEGGGGGGGGGNTKRDNEIIQ